MRGTRVKKLLAIFRAGQKAGIIPPDDKEYPKKHFRFFKKLYNRGALDQFFPSM